VDLNIDTCSLSLDRRYRRIVRCATEAFLLNGYAGTSVEDVAIEASVSKPTIYKMIGDKYALAKVVLETLAASLESECRKALDVDLDLEECLLNFAMTYIDWRNRRVGKTNHYSYLRLLVEISGQHPEFSKMWVDITRHSVAIPLAEYIKKRMDTGDFLEEDPLFIASQFIRTMYNSVESILAQNLHTTDVEQTRRKIRMFLRGATSEPYRAAQQGASPGVHAPAHS
jgi:AcrR family transcriptional regulator